MGTKIKKKQNRSSCDNSAQPSSAPELTILGAEQFRLGNAAAAEKTWREAVRLDPSCTAAWTCLLDLMLRDRRTAEAGECLDRLLELSGQSVCTTLTYADRYVEIGQPEKARNLFEQVLQSLPSLEADVLLKIAKLRYDASELQEVIGFTSRVLELQPNRLEAISLRGNTYGRMGLAAEEVQHYRRYLEIQPDMHVHSELIFKLNYLPETTPETLYEESRRWNQRYAAPITAEIPAHTNVPDPDRPLKIGYVSPDLYGHAIMKLLPPVLDMHNERLYEPFFYSLGSMQDVVTEAIERDVKNFIKLPASRHEIAERVREDGIDILVDLAGHTMIGQALLTFAMKPAPIQVSWLGVLATTGLDTIDYFIGDQYMPHPGTEHLFSEKVYRLPRLPCAYRPFRELTLAPSPYHKNGYLTFGCFNNPRKITKNAVHVWSAILHLFPDAKMLLKYESINHEAVNSHLKSWFAQYGIPPERLSFEGAEAPRVYLNSWNKVDIALDPFPYNGGTTTMDALWMGVPVVSMSGRLPVACAGKSLLTAMRMPVANSPEEYVLLAANLAKAIPGTPQIRQNVREAMKKSALCDERGLMRSLEAAYRAMWRTWCETQTQQAVSDLAPLEVCT